LAFSISEARIRPHVNTYRLTNNCAAINHSSVLEHDSRAVHYRVLVIPRWSIVFLSAEHNFNRQQYHMNKISVLTTYFIFFGLVEIQFFVSEKREASVDTFRYWIQANGGKEVIS